MSALLLIVALTARASVAPQPALSAADGADGRCIVVMGYVGAHGAPEQAEGIRRMIPYFIGRITGRDGRPDLAQIIARAADDAKASGVHAQAEGERCEAEFVAGTSGLLGVRAAVGLPPRAPRP